MTDAEIAALIVVGCFLAYPAYLMFKHSIKTESQEQQLGKIAAKLHMLELKNHNPRMEDWFDHTGDHHIFYAPDGVIERLKLKDIFERHEMGDVFHNRTQDLHNKFYYMFSLVFDKPSWVVFEFHSKDISIPSCLYLNETGINDNWANEVSESLEYQEITPSLVKQVDLISGEGNMFLIGKRMREPHAKKIVATLKVGLSLVGAIRDEQNTK